MSEKTWQKTACIPCECNCGLEVELGGETGRSLVRFRGDRAHPASQGYACEKPHRLNFYQSSERRLTSPMRRREDGSYEAIDWHTAIREIVQALGFHPDYTGKRYLLPKGRALIITTRHDQLGPGGDETGVAASEMTAPYDELVEGQVA